METRYIFGKRLRKLRKERKITQNELGETIGVSGRSIGQYETGMRTPDNIDIIVKLADFFQVTTDYLLGKTDDKNNKVIQTNFLDGEGKEHTLEIEHDKNDKNITLAQIQEVIKVLEKIGIDPKTINLHSS